MAKGDTKTNQYLDIAANGTRSDFPASCCESRSQTLIREVGERIMDLEDEVERLENNPDVADIVATYADLQSYDTSQLTDKDVIRVLQDETHDGESTYYRWSTSTNTWTYIGESKQYTDFIGTDGTEAGEAGLVPAPETTDAGKFLGASGLWEAVQGGGGVTELTTADYNWPTDNPTGVALWLLDSGWYTAPGITVFFDVAKAYGTFSNGGELFYVSKFPTANVSRIVVIGKDNTVAVYSTQLNSGLEYSSPTKTVSLVQTTGTSTTSVMSQNATTSMLYADPSTKYKIQLGVNALVLGNAATGIGYAANATGDNAIAIGNNSTVGHKGGVGIGVGATTNAQGEMNIGAGSLTSFGYNNSAYRLLSGLYDGQTAHDAATKGQLDSIAIQNAGAPTTSTVGTVGQLLEDTTNGKLYICTAADTVTPSYTWTEVGAGGGGGGVTELTSADYNYPDNNPDGVALWKLDGGLYKAVNAKVYFNTSTSTTNDGKTFLVLKQPGLSSSVKRTGIISQDSSGAALVYSTYTDSGVADVSGLSIGGPTVEQTTGTSTLRVMSQNAVSSTLFNDPATCAQVKIGSSSVSNSVSSVAVGASSKATDSTSVAIGYDSSASGFRALAIGSYSSASQPMSVAVGPNSKATLQGQFDISTGSYTTGGYNSSNYRLLTGLYDGQSAHDAATVGQITPLSDSSAPTTATVGTLGRIFIDTTNADAYMCVAVDDVTPSYTWKKITA